MRKIIWKKWHDPILEAIEQFEEEDVENFDGDSFETLTMSYRNRSQIGPCLIGPMGVIPLNEHNTPSKDYNFQMMHTNFRITVGDKGVLKSVDGVEALDIFTPYRCRIAIGKAFNEEEVMNNIDKALGVVTPVTKNFNNTLRAMLNRKFAFWAIQVDRQGKLSIYNGENPKDVNSKMRLASKDISRTIVSW